MSDKPTLEEEHEMTITELQARVGETNAANGWHTGDISPVERIALIVTECAEAIEEIRNSHPISETYYPDGDKPEGVPTEIADVVIRCLDFAFVYGIDLAAVIETKLAYNETRGWRHGGKAL